MLKMQHGADLYAMEMRVKSANYPQRQIYIITANSFYGPAT